MQTIVKGVVVTVMVVWGMLAGAVAVTSTAATENAVTLAGDVVCAKCTLKVEGLEHCQNVLLVGTGTEQKQYWLVANDVNTKFGDVCAAKRPVTVTGTVDAKDGKQWLTPSKIEPRGAQ